MTRTLNPTRTRVNTDYRAASLIALEPARTESTVPAKPQPNIMKSTITTWSLTRLAECEPVHTRARYDDEIVTIYRDQLLDGDEFPPVTVFRLGAHHLFVDGFHRAAAYRLAGVAQVPVELIEGTREQAIAYALQPHLRPGFPVNMADKRRGMEIALRELPRLTAPTITKLLAVSPSLAASR